MEWKPTTSDSTDDVKQKIQNREYTPPDEQRLICYPPRKHHPPCAATERRWWSTRFFADDGSKLTVTKFSARAPQWHTCHKGLNIEGRCENQ
ncbi:hypothetical protein PHMEG_00025088 [Phytophthora megakarya]|uniref:Uncharacterized protein n=1 Tax=Phytophthora megakarya TaxID=4795 RepID=A0A225VFE8_9STRA|nr:hypothetical protein PHMEG_00025088 [Phytophthora megakarya]